MKNSHDVNTVAGRDAKQVSTSINASKSVLLSFNDVEYRFETPAHLESHVLRTIEAFVSFLASTTDSVPPVSSVELSVRYIGYVSGLIEADGDGYMLLSCFLLDQLDQTLLNQKEIHTLAAEAPGEDENRRLIIKAFFDATSTTKSSTRSRPSALFAADSNAVIYVAFGGQGNTEYYFEELRQVYSTYNCFVRDLVVQAADILNSLLHNEHATDQYPQGIDILQWLQNPASTPSTSYLLSAPVSFPLIGLLQLAQFCVTCRVLNRDPGDVQGRIAGFTGHSQGIVVATVLATARTWEDIDKSLELVLKLLFFIGYRSQQSYPETLLPLHAAQESVSNSDGIPTPMLNIQHVLQAEVESQVNLLNSHLPSEQHIAVSLINGPRNFVVGGPPLALHGLNVKLRCLKPEAGVDQSHIPFNKRRPRLSTKYLPITAPFHSFHLEPARQLVRADLRRHQILISSTDLHTPVFGTVTGENLQEVQTSENIATLLLDMIMTQQVNWPTCSESNGATHILDFGPGGTSGVGLLMQRSKEGTGTHVVLASILSGTVSGVHYQPEVFQCSRPVAFGVSWSRQYGPCLVKDESGNIMIWTKMSKLLRLPPIMIAGMTPTTIHPGFVVASMNAGYHVELAGGGYYDAKSLTEAVISVQTSAPAGRGITINLIYANPRAIQWQIPLIRQLQHAGHVIEGVTLGAGVPSLGVATEYIETLGLRHIGFKPGSVESINQVIAIAKEFPKFPILLQWTGGRGGGHHSFEDVHDPIIQTYAAIRACQNIVLIIGSGFGGSDDTWPYLLGTWANEYGFPKMPFDGILFGSRMMVAKEARTSDAAKCAIAYAAGTDNSHWHETYDRPTGGVLTVTSEMGQPIHKIATRGVCLWHELDKTIFALDRTKQMKELQRKRGYIIDRLNKDFSKVWFGQTSAGLAADVSQMTYLQVLMRLVELLYVRTSERWIDASYAILVGDFIRRLEERFAHSDASSRTGLFAHYDELAEPSRIVEKVKLLYPEAERRLITAEDELFFLSICKRQGQKPVTFIPILDQSFETWFKKDSLWQSEDVEAVVGQDIERTCILQGPVAVKYSTPENINEPVKDILDNINTALIGLVKEHGTDVVVQTTEYFEMEWFPVQDTTSIEVSKIGKRIVFSLSEERNLPSEAAWFEALAGSKPCWRRALLMSERIIQGKKAVPNPVRRVFKPRHGARVELHQSEDSEGCTVSLFGSSRGDVLASICMNLCGVITTRITSYETADAKPLDLAFEFSYHPDTPHALIREVMDLREERIRGHYQQLWIGGSGASQHPSGSRPSPDQTFTGSLFVVSQEDVKAFVAAIGNQNEYYVDRTQKTAIAPMDFGIVVGWKAITKALLSVDGDLLKLVHLSNEFRYLADSGPFKIGEKLNATARVTAVLIQDSGKQVEITCAINSGDCSRMEIVSRFLYREDQTNYQDSFRFSVEPEYELQMDTATEVQLLTSRDWFHPMVADVDEKALGQRLIFRMSTLRNLESKTTYLDMETKGEVLLQTPSSRDPISIAAVQYKSLHGPESYNEVIDYLDRHGTKVMESIPLAAPTHCTEEAVQFIAPSSSMAYSIISKDHNPIHVSEVFAAFADLPGPIVHGMHTSAIIRGICENTCIENGDPRLMRSFNASFHGMVRSGDSIDVEIQHVAMKSGCKVIEIVATKAATGEKVLNAECEIEQAPTAYLFTGQGSQTMNMGMDLYATSPVAREVWDRADKHFDDNYGFKLSDIVRKNPKEMTVHFGGRTGAAVRANYMRMTYESIGPDGQHQRKRFFDVDENSLCHTFSSPKGLLHSTEFTQPALTVVEKAIFDDMVSRGVVNTCSTFAGHSLGEYSALAAVANIMPVERLLSIVFYRGLCMQAAVERDESGRSDFAMVAINPSRVSNSFEIVHLERVAEIIRGETHSLLEIVNHNIEHQQYVCAGTLQNLAILGMVTDALATVSMDDDALISLVRANVVELSAGSARIELRRGKATIPLTGIDVPFHSSFLIPHLPAFREILLENIQRSWINPSTLIDRYVPNVTAKAFSISKESFEQVYAITQSPKIKDVLDQWDSEYAAEVTAQA